jgi:beta-galactosidase
MNRREFLSRSTSATLGIGLSSGLGGEPLGGELPAPESRAAAGRRTTISLNGQWDVEDSVESDAMPSKYTHRSPVPGLAHSALPAFPDVDQFQSRQLLYGLVGKGRFSQAEFDRLGNAPGISYQKRNYFWYRRTFTAPGKTQVALLRINKAQFGTAVFLNGVRIGEHYPCFTSVTFDITKTIQWGGSNELVVRVGAHPGVLPPYVVGGTDYEKNRWTPGIYDDVTLMTMSNPVIASVQVAPRLSQSAVLVQTELRNYSDRAMATEVSQQAFEWESRTRASARIETRVDLAAGESKTITQLVPIPTAHLWSPEDPFLYTVTTSTSGDTAKTRFGMRDFHFDTVTQRAYLNGRPYFLRGSNITLHRFFEDPDVGILPWDEDWLHRLLVTIPKQMHWNAFRFCIGPVPDRWLQIADEAGLLIQNEYFVWVGNPLPNVDFGKQYNLEQMTTEYTEWMRDNWNHPGVAIWDATNESWLPGFDAIINKVRQFDLSNRPWENSYNSPAGSNDPVEDHQYLLITTALGDASGSKNRTPDFKLEDMGSMFGPRDSTNKTAHAMILNEYGWVWLNRDGSPTLVTQKLYSKLLPGETNTSENRLKLQAYILGGETEFWRAYRRYAGVLHFVYLTSSEPDGFTSDSFRDVKTLELNPYFAKEMEQAFKPLGVYLGFWHPALIAGQRHRFNVAMVNDEDRPRIGKLRLSFADASEKEIAGDDVPFSIEPLGAETYYFEIKVPETAGSYSLRAVANPVDDAGNPTISHRDVVLEIATSTK